MTYKITLCSFWLSGPALFVFCTRIVFKMTRNPLRTSRPARASVRLLGWLDDGEPVATNGERHRIGRIVVPWIVHRYLTIWKDLDDLTFEVVEAHETVSIHQDKISLLQTRGNKGHRTLTSWWHDVWSDVRGQQTHFGYTSLIQIITRRGSALPTLLIGSI